jgi:hypothetical protein
MYVVDERAVADAVVLRARMRLVVGEQSFRSEDRGPVARSFRRDRDARSFRLAGSARQRRVYH